MKSAKAILNDLWMIIRSENTKITLHELIEQTQKEAKKEGYNEAIQDAIKSLKQTSGQWNSDFNGQKITILKLLKP